MTRRVQIVTAEEAAAGIPDQARVAVTGNNMRMAPETMLAAIQARFAESAAPRDLALIYPMMIADQVEGRSVAGSGLNRLAAPGLLREVIGGSFSREPREFNDAITSGQFDAYNVSIGTVVGLVRASARGDRYYLTSTGVDTYVDPRRDGGRLNDRQSPDLSEVVDVDGEEWLRYRVPAIDVAILRASYADEFGNISFEEEPFTLGALHMAIAAKAAGGRVVVEVGAVVQGGSLDPQLVKIPGALVDQVVVAPDQRGGSTVVSSGRTPEWSFSGRRRSTDQARSLGRRLDVAKTVIAGRALQQMLVSGLTNLGAGVGMYDVPALARRLRVDPSELDLSIEQGAFGGWAEPGGVAMNPEALLDTGDVFDLYTGGVLDLTILSFGEVDRFGDVNVSRFGGMLIGSGGFIDIAQNARNILFCGTFTAGADVVFTEEGIAIRSEGRPLKFVEDVAHLTFNARSARNRAASVAYVTERAVFRLEEGGGLAVTEVAPGLDLERDVLAVLPFDVRVADEVGEMDLTLARQAERKGAEA